MAHKTFFFIIIDGDIS